MSTIDTNGTPQEFGTNGNGNGTAAHANGNGLHPQPAEAAGLHRIREVRRQQGVSPRCAARQLQLDMRSLRRQESPQTDLRLSELYAWQQVLDVPIADLLVDSDGPLSQPVMKRAQMLRLMKTAGSIMENAPNKQIRRMAQMLVEQLIEIMPELEGVTPWHEVGQRRSLEELGRAVDRTVTPGGHYD